MENTGNGYKETELLENIIAQLPGHIYWKDRKGVILGCNHEQAKAIGLTSRHQIKGLTDHEVLPKKLADEVTAIDQKVMASGRPHTVEEVLEEPDGQMSIWLSKKVPLYDNAEQVIGVLGISIDITAQKEAEKLEKEKIIAEEIAKHNKAAAGNIAHDLRAPLGNVRLLIEPLPKFMLPLIESYKIAKEAGLTVPDINLRQLAIIEHSMRNLKKLIGDMDHHIDLVLANLASRDIRTDHYTILPIDTVVKAAYDAYPFEQKEQRALVHLNLEENFKFWGSDFALTKILDNLFINALDFIKSEGKGEIYIWTEVKEDGNELHFKDTAKGASQEICDKMFDYYFTTRESGSGLGLGSSKSYMKSFGGDIRAESVEGEYMEFILTFPKPENSPMNVTTDKT